MIKAVTRDQKSIRVKVRPQTDEVMQLLINTIPRLSYDEILDGELEKRLRKENVTVESVELSAADGIREVLLSKAVFDAISKPPGC